MISPLHRPLFIGSVLCTLAALSPQAQQAPIDRFFEAFTAEGVRLNPNQATATRYGTGAEQDELEAQLTPSTHEWRQKRVLWRGAASSNCKRSIGRNWPTFNACPPT